MSSRRAFLGSVLLGAVLVLIAGGQAWVRGRTTDPVLGAGPVEALGSAAAPGALALALVAAAAAVGLLTGGPVARRVSAAVLALAAPGIAGSRRWAGLSARYDAPAPAADSRGAVRTAWDDLSEGVDPTTSDP